LAPLSLIDSYQAYTRQLRRRRRVSGCRRSGCCVV